MHIIKQNDADYKVYVTLLESGVPVGGVPAADVVLWYSQNGGILTPTFVSAPQWVEFSPLNVPGVYALTLPADIVDTVGAIYVRILSGGASIFDAVVLELRVVPLDLTDLLTPITRLLGLSQENFRMDNHVYNLRGELVSANISIFSSNVDTISNTSPIARYAIAASYDGLGRLQLYTMTQI